ncbi:MAG: phosphoglucomutase/phosphomannomutase family protein, partial [Acidobacteriaceae bacterium]|nr:phosphoglucomutase/phosphomannomutase family protein [Acidobacteriaceae bacterium]
MANRSPVKFGTDGWRGIIADDFTFANVRVAAAAIANYLHTSSDPKEATAKGVCIGYDTRFESPLFARAVAEVVAASGIPVRLANRITPTPALSYAVRHLGAAGGVMITSSHNPYQWNGVKYKAWYGGSGKPSIMAAIESYLDQPLNKAATPAPIEETDFVPDYLDALRHFADLSLIAKSGFRIAVDCMYGAGAGILAGIFKEIGVDYIEIRAEHNPLFPGINPEPIEPHVRALQEAVVEHKCDAGLVTDGDADRIGAVDEHGNFVDPHK